MCSPLHGGPPRSVGISSTGVEAGVLTFHARVSTLRGLSGDSSPPTF